METNNQDKAGSIITSEKHIDIFTSFEGEKPTEYIKLKREDFNTLIALTAIEAARTGFPPAAGDVTASVSSTEPKFTDIANEKYRTYHFPDGSVYTIAFPVKLNVKRKPEGDSHRVIDSENTSHYVRAGWNAISWGGLDGGTAYSF